MDIKELIIRAKQIDDSLIPKALRLKAEATLRLKIEAAQAASDLETREKILSESYALISNLADVSVYNLKLQASLGDSEEEILDVEVEQEDVVQDIEVEQGTEEEDENEIGLSELDQVQTEIDELLNELEVNEHVIEPVEPVEENMDNLVLEDSADKSPSEVVEKYTEDEGGDEEAFEDITSEMATEVGEIPVVETPEEEVTEDTEILEDDAPTEETISEEDEGEESFTNKDLNVMSSQINTMIDDLLKEM